MRRKRSRARETERERAQKVGEVLKTTDCMAAIQQRGGTVFVKHEELSIVGYEWSERKARQTKVVQPKGKDDQRPFYLALLLGATLKTKSKTGKKERKVEEAFYS